MRRTGCASMYVVVSMLGVDDRLGTVGVLIACVFVQEACSRYPNVEAIVAYMPEAFGTHHSKMMVLLRHDDLAQYVLLCSARLFWVVGE